MKFKIGSCYSFSIESITKVPEKGNHFVLKHESGRKMLLNTQHYVKYNFNLGQTIECRVDKVNCSGQVFLEPRHPHYNEGSFYDFNLLSIKNNEDKTNSILVRDFFDNEIQVFVNTHVELKDQGKVLLKVERIKKGIPVLSFPGTEKLISSINTTNKIKLRVAAIVYENSEEYFSLADDFGIIVSRIKVKHYKHYGLTVGECFLFQSRGYDINGLTLVEPENPWYKIGESYTFKISSIENYIDLDGNDVKTVIVVDKNQKKCGVAIVLDQLKHFENLNQITCRVNGFRKGRPQLEIDL